MSAQEDCSRTELLQQRLTKWLNIIDLTKKILLEKNLKIEMAAQIDAIEVRFTLSILKTGKIVKFYV